VKRAALAAALGAALASLVSPPPALAAPDKTECIAAFDRGQRARTDEKLRQARSELLVCTQESCPAVLRADCAGVLEEVQKLLPTVVLAASDGNQDLADVRVTANGKAVTTHLDGKAIELDPGEYVFRFEWHGKTVDEKHTVREGEKGRVLRGTFAPPPSSSPARRDAPAPRDERGTVGWVVPSALAAVAVAGFTVAGISRLRFDSKVDDARASGGCAPDCTQTQRDDISKTLVTANVALIGGAVLLAGAIVTWITLAR
jgi:hypothetical protein